MIEKLLTKHDLAQKFDVHDNTAIRWMTALERAGYPLMRQRRSHMMPHKDLFVVCELDRLLNIRIKLEDAAVQSVNLWRGRQQREGHQPPHTCQDRSLQILLDMFQTDKLKCILLDLSPNRDTILDGLIASVDQKRLSNSLIDHLSEHEVREVCKRLV